MITAEDAKSAESGSLGTTRPTLESWFNCPERVALLQFRAAHWEGTPFMPNSSVAGPRGGVSCQKLASALYSECGFATIPVPEVPMSHARFSTESLVAPWMDARQEFRRVEQLVGDNEPYLPGDLLGFRIHRTVHHVGVLLMKGIFIHTIQGPGTVLSSLSDPTWGTRLEMAWRPLLRRRVEDNAPYQTI